MLNTRSNIKVTKNAESLPIKCTWEKKTIRTEKKNLCVSSIKTSDYVDPGH